MAAEREPNDDEGEWLRGAGFTGDQHGVRVFVRWLSEGKELLSKHGLHLVTDEDLRERHELLEALQLQQNNSLRMADRLTEAVDWVRKLRGAPLTQRLARESWEWLAAYEAELARRGET